MFFQNIAAQLYVLLFIQKVLFFLLYYVYFIKYYY